MVLIRLHVCLFNGNREFAFYHPMNFQVSCSSSICIHLTCSLLYRICRLWIYLFSMFILKTLILAVFTSSYKWSSLLWARTQRIAHDFPGERVRVLSSFPLSLATSTRLLEPSAMYRWPAPSAQMSWGSTCPKLMQLVLNKVLNIPQIVTLFVLLDKSMSKYFVKLWSSTGWKWNLKRRGDFETVSN